MKITRNNYEIYALDHSEGNLSPELTKELLYFFELNQDLKKEFEEFENIKLTPENIKFDKKNLLKSIPEESLFDISEFEYLSVAETENDISENDKKRLNEILENNKDKKEEFLIIKSCRIKADKNIKFPHKNKIKKYPIFNIVKKSLSIAASIIFLTFMITTIYNYNNTFESQSITAHKIQSKVKNKIKIKNTKKYTEVKNIKKSFHKKSIKINKNYELKNEKKDSLLNKTLINDEFIIVIPKVKQGVFVSNKKEKNISILAKINKQKPELYLNDNENKNDNKNKYWVIAETVVNVWKGMTSSELVMNNTYASTGKIENLNISSNNFKFKKTFRNK